MHEGELVAYTLNVVQTMFTALLRTTSIHAVYSPALQSTALHCKAVQVYLCFFSKTTPWLALSLL